MPIIKNPARVFFISFYGLFVFEVQFSSNQVQTRVKFKVTLTERKNNVLSTNSRWQMNVKICCGWSKTEAGKYRPYTRWEHAPKSLGHICHKVPTVCAVPNPTDIKPQERYSKKKRKTGRTISQIPSWSISATPILGKYACHHPWNGSPLCSPPLPTILREHHPLEPDKHASPS